MASTRDQIIETMSQLMEAQGYHATGLNQIVKESGAPKGSLYYYFPDGKEGLAAEAIERAGELVAGRIRGGLSRYADAAGAVEKFVMLIADGIEMTGFSAGGPLTTVAMETATTNERLNLVCLQAYERLQGAFGEKLIACGYSESRAQELAIFIVSAIEGGIILSRTRHSGDSLRRVAQELGRFLAAEHPN